MNNQQKLNIEDGSGDKDFFTIIPNYILNHSTANDQALYLQLKRLTGDRKDCCYPSFGYLREKLGIGKKALKKSLDYLIEHNWIENLGKRQIMTSGGYQWVSAYRIKDIWKLNTEHFKGGSKRDHLAKGGSKDAKGGLKETKGGSVVSSKQELNNNLKRTFSFKKKINPFYRGNPMRESPVGSGKWFVIEDGQWLEFAGSKKDIEYK